MVNKNTLGRALLALALAPVMAACTAAPASSPSASVAPTPTQTAPTLSPAEQDLANAKQAVTNLWSDGMSSSSCVRGCGPGPLSRMFVGYRTRVVLGSAYPQS